MCLINIKPAGKSWKDNIFLNAIHTGFETQKDLSGFGLYEANTGKVFIDKPYATATDMLYTIKNMVKDDDILVVHHRMATDGLVNAKNCHPIPIKIKGASKDVVDVITGHIDVPVLFHNGVIRRYCTSAIDSDSYLFAQEVLAEDGVIDDIYNDPFKFSFANINLLDWSRFAMLRPGLHQAHSPLVMFGEEFIKDNGFYFSNNGYKRTSTVFMMNSPMKNKQQQEETYVEDDAYSTLIFSPIMPQEYVDKVKKINDAKKDTKEKKTNKDVTTLHNTFNINCDNVSDLFVDEFNKQHFEIECCNDGTPGSNPHRKKGRKFEVDRTNTIGVLVGKCTIYDNKCEKYVEVTETFYMASLWANSAYANDNKLYTLIVKKDHVDYYKRVLEFISKEENY